MVKRPAAGIVLIESWLRMKVPADGLAIRSPRTAVVGDDQMLISAAKAERGSILLTTDEFNGCFGRDGRRKEKNKIAVLYLLISCQLY